MQRRQYDAATMQDMSGQKIIFDSVRFHVLMVVGTAGLFGVGSPLQYLIIRFSKGREMLGAASIQIAFNVGNAVAAYLGGLALQAGLDDRYPALVGVPLALIGSVLLFTLHYKYERRLSK